MEKKEKNSATERTAGVSWGTDRSPVYVQKKKIHTHPALSLSPSLSLCVRWDFIILIVEPPHPVLLPPSLVKARKAFPFFWKINFNSFVLFFLYENDENARRKRIYIFLILNKKKKRKSGCVTVILKVLHVFIFHLGFWHGDSRGSCSVQHTRQGGGHTHAHSTIINLGKRKLCCLNCGRLPWVPYSPIYT